MCVYSNKLSLCPDILPLKLRKIIEMIILKIHVGRLFPAIILFFMALTALGGCSMANYGKLKSNPDITRAFEAYQIMPDHKYYYRGTQSRPFVIVGINENYELNSKLWVAIDPQSKDFRTLIDRISLQGSGSSTQPWGFTILDNSGNAVGVWYSAIRAAAVEVNESGQIVNLSPLRTVTRGDQMR
jgi:hypothetical protein